MRSKFIEIRDANTLITAIAIKTAPDSDEEKAFYRHSGWGESSVILIKINGEARAEYDPFVWFGSRTMREAHRYIERHYDEIPNYGLVDVQVLLGETTTPKTSDILGANREVAV
jgi:hypothetical protein